jgi:hypothetical protein
MAGWIRKIRLGRIRGPEHVWADWMAANEVGDVGRAAALAAEMTQVAPDSFGAWFEAGLHAKARREWALCLEWNRRAVELFGDNEVREYDGVNPAAWNLGIAATALGDWETARRAWTIYGIAGMESGSGSIDVDYGQVPIRVNPDRPSLALQDVPNFGTTEVVWCWRRSPAHAVVASVPLPESGHRFRDVVLHDGEPKGSRRLVDAEVSVFDELEKLHDSETPTWQAHVEGATSDDIASLGDIAGPKGLGADNWSGMNVLCSECSHGSPDAGHRHEPAPEGSTILGLAGVEVELSDCLEEWTTSRPGIRIASLELLW